MTMDLDRSVGVALGVGVGVSACMGVVISVSMVMIVDTPLGDGCRRRDMRGCRSRCECGRGCEY